MRVSYLETMFDWSNRISHRSTINLVIIASEHLKKTTGKLLLLATTSCYQTLHFTLIRCTISWRNQCSVWHLKLVFWVWLWILLIIATSCIPMRDRASSPFITILHHHIASSHCFCFMFFQMVTDYCEVAGSHPFTCLPFQVVVVRST